MNPSLNVYLPFKNNYHLNVFFGALCNGQGKESRSSSEMMRQLDQASILLEEGLSAHNAHYREFYGRLETSQAKLLVRLGRGGAGGEEGERGRD